MKIEAKKSKLNMNKNQASRPVKETVREKRKKPETMYVEKPTAALSRSGVSRIKIPRIKLPRIKLPRINLSKPAIPKPRVQKLRGKRTAVIVVLVAVPVLLAAVWLGLNLHRHSVPGPLFTENNLPPAPPADSNGYALLYDDQIYAEYAAKDICDVNLFSNAGTIENFLDKSRGEYTVAKNLAARDDVKKLMGLYRAIIAKPLFADMAKPDARDSQRTNVYMALHNAVTASIITRLQEKKYGAAFSLMKGQLGLNIQFVKSARSMNAFSMSMRAYDKSLRILKSMLGLFGADRAMGNEAVTACRDIGAMMDSFDPQNVGIAPIIMFEYILSWKQTFNPSIKNPEAMVYQMMNRKALVFFDRGLTQKLYDERWKKLYDLSKKPTDQTIEEVRKLQEQRFAVGRFWWFHNAVGKKYLDTIPITAYQLFYEWKNWSVNIRQKQNDIASVINALKEPVKEPGKQGKKQTVRKAVKSKKRR